MSQANRKLVWIYAIWMVGGLTLVYLATALDEGFFFTLLLLMAVIFVACHQVRCRACRWPLIKTRRGGFVPFAPKTCPKCGKAVDELGR